MNLDEQALFARFKEQFDTSSNQVLTLNKPVTVVDKTKPWCRYSVSLGDRWRAELGANPTYAQTGKLYLQVFVPKALGINAGDALVEKFDNLFCDWRSPDGALQIRTMTPNRSETDTYYQVNIRFSFISLRKRT